MKRISRTTLFTSTQLAFCLIATSPLASYASDVPPAAAAPATTTGANTDSSKKVKNLDAVKVTGSAVTVDKIAPTQGSMIAIQPQSIIGEQYLRENVAPTGDYSDAISIAPSISTVAPNGPGLMEAQSVTMRGFQDGEYNVTFDGIPWGDSNDFTHHST